MKVWLLNPFDNLPHEGYRPQRYWLMAEALAARGDEATVFSSSFSHALKKPRVLPSGTLKRARETGPAPALVIVPSPSYPRNICLKRLWSHWRLSRNWLRAAAKMSPPDVVVVSSPPLSLVAAARRFCASTGARLVVDVQDAWPETFLRVAPRFLLRPLFAIAGRNYRAADAITAVAKRYLDLAVSYGAAAPRHLARLATSMPQRDAASSSAVAAANDAPRAALALAYVGNMSLSYDLATLIDAVAGADGVTLDLAGAGPDEAGLRARAAKCPRIRFHGYLVEEDLGRMLARCDAGVVPMFADSCVGVPGKISDYLAAGLAVLNTLPGETAEILESARAGVTCLAGDAGSYAKAFGEIAADLPRFREGALALAPEFDAAKVYADYAEWVAGLGLRVRP